MKRTLISLWIVAGFAILQSSVLMAGNAQVQLANNSIRMYPGDCSCGFGLTWTIHFSSIFTEDPAMANGEIAPLAQPADFSHWSYLVLEDPSAFASTTYAELDLPSADTNGNGTPDFLEVAESVTVTTGGKYAVIWSPGYGLLTFNWTRAAGSRTGTCLLFMNDPILGQMGPFTHPFELVNYTGQLNYTPGSNSVAGTIHLAKDGQPSELLDGLVTLTKSPTNSFNLLTLPGGDWTNQAGAFTFSDCALTRDPAHPTVYRGPFQNPGGPFRSWQLSIVDTNDANGNGIPDLSDLVVALPRRPILSLSRAATQLLLRISGDVSRTYLVQEAASLNPTNWTTIQSLTLTNDPQVFTLPLPSASPRFWRVQAQ